MELGKEPNWLDGVREGEEGHESFVSYIAKKLNTDERIVIDNVIVNSQM